MKILFYYPGDLSFQKRGTPIRAYKLYSFLHEQHDVHLVAGKMPADFVGEGTVLMPRFKGFNWVYRIWILNRLIKEIRPDIIYGQTHRSLLTLWLAACGRKTCIDLHGLYHEEVGSNAVSKMFRKMFTDFLIKRMSGVTVPSHTLLEIYGNIAPKSCVVPGGIDMKTISTATPERLFPLDIPVIAYCGNIRSYQGVDYLLAALKKIRHLPWNFLFVCSSEEVKAQQLLKLYELEDRTKLLWDLPHERVFSLLKGVDIAVVPRPDIPVTRYAFPSKLVEYLVSGCAVIATDVSDVRYVIQHKETGWLVEPGDVDALAMALVNALGDPSSRRYVSLKAHELVLYSYDWRIIVANLSQFLYSLSA